MNKKLVLGIIAGVVALIIIAVSAVAILKHFDVNILKKDEPSSSSVTDSGNNSKDNGSTQNGADVVKKGSVKTPEIKTTNDETIKVPIKIDKNPGIWGCQFNFDYDTSIFEYVGYENGNLFEECDVNVNNGVIKSLITKTDLENTKKNGTIITFELKIKEDAPKGTYELKLRDDSQIVNIEEQIVSPKINIGKVTVE